jgi:uncharacterized FAD-dependent dehydrogenase
MIRVSQIKLPIHHDDKMLEEKICQQLRIKREDLISWNILRRSVDARKKPDLKFVYTVDVKIENESKILKRCEKVHNNNVMLTKITSYELPVCGKEKLRHRPVIIGSGPAGLYCAWLLAKSGFNPVVLERGKKALERKKKVDAFWAGQPLDQNSNVQFGEGGAGTFSDGKLNTSVKDPLGRNKKVLELFVEAGAPLDILYDHKPHLGTDLLITIVTNLRKQIEELGGSFYFDSQVTDFIIEDNFIKKIQINDTEWLDTEVLVMAIGHSARDTFFRMKKRGICMEAKSFAVGVRIEHPQKMINMSQYGMEQSDILGAANYKLTHQLSNKRGIYSFCMCPGGYVVNASSENGHLAVNGMSYHLRDSRNANSAMIVTVTPEDYMQPARKYLEENQKGSSIEIEHNPLSGIYFQRSLEKAAFELNNGRIPVQTFQDFKAGKTTTQFGEVSPCMKGGYEMSNLRGIFPSFISDSLVEGINACGRKIRGFDRGDALLSGVESRTSSPVKIPRDANFECNVRGIYPCGEGAGYAGGITSAAMDGLRVGEAICKKYMNFL